MLEVIIVDWDDTLFPTSWLSEKGEFRAWQKNWSSASRPPAKSKGFISVQNPIILTSYL